MPCKNSKCVAQAFERYCAHVGHRPKHVHSDGGKEFLGSFSALLRTHLIKQTYSCPYSSFENSIVERRVRSLKETTRRLMLESGLPIQFYGRAMHTAATILNVHPTQGDPVHSHTTPWKLIHPERPTPKLKVFGCLAYALKVPKSSRDDCLKYPGSVGWWVGFSDYSGGDMIYDPKDGTFKIRRDVICDEHWRYAKDSKDTKRSSLAS